MKYINPADGPRALGHYSPALVHEGILYLSGQLPIDETSGITGDSPFSVQLTRLLSNCRSLLKAAGSGPSAVLSLTLYLTNLSNWDEADGLLAGFFGDHRPARSVLHVASIRKGFAVQATMTAVASERDIADA